MAAYKRIILKLSGETLAPEKKKIHPEMKSYSFDAARVDGAAEMIGKLHDMGVQVGVVMGGGNIWRGRFTDAMNPVNADQMGMLATIINALAVQDALVRLGYKATVLTAQEMTRFARLYTRDTAISLLEEGHIVLLAGGSGNPFFTTDTAAALRAAELNADAVFKGTNVDGIFDADPEEDKNKPKEEWAKLIPELTYEEAIEKKLKVMDLTAFMICIEQKVPVIRVFNMDKLENILKIAAGENLGTTAHL